MMRFLRRRSTARIGLGGRHSLPGQRFAADASRQQEFVPVDVIFEAIRAATTDASEEARLVFANCRLVALLVPAEPGWFLQLGLGPCEREGLVFETLEAAEAWIRSSITAMEAEPIPSADCCVQHAIF